MTNKKTGGDRSAQNPNSHRPLKYGEKVQVVTTKVPKSKVTAFKLHIQSFLKPLEITP